MNSHRAETTHPLEPRPGTCCSLSPLSRTLNGVPRAILHQQFISTREQRGSEDWREARLQQKDAPLWREQPTARELTSGLVIPIMRPSYDRTLYQKNSNGIDTFRRRVENGEGRWDSKIRPGHMGPLLKRASGIRSNKEIIAEAANRELFECYRWTQKDNDEWPRLTYMRFTCRSSFAGLSQGSIIGCRLDSMAVVPPAISTPVYNAFQSPEFYIGTTRAWGYRSGWKPQAANAKISCSLVLSAVTISVRLGTLTPTLSN